MSDVWRLDSGSIWLPYSFQNAPNSKDIILLKKQGKVANLEDEIENGESVIYFCITGGSK